MIPIELSQSTDTDFWNPDAHPLFDFPKQEKEESSDVCIECVNPTQEIGQQIQAQRRVMKLSQSALGEMAGIKGYKISQIELGVRLPDADIVKRLSSQLSLPSDFMQSVTSAQIERDTRPSTLRVLRFKRGLTQVQLSTLSGVDFRIISQTELHKCALTLQQAAKIAVHLDAAAEMLIEPSSSQKTKRIMRVLPSTAFKRARLEQDYTQKSLAKIAKVSLKTIFLLDHGIGRPNPEDEEKLAAILKL